MAVMKLAQANKESELENLAHWVRRARAGDIAAFESIVRHQQDRLRAFLARRTDYSRDVDDLAQDTFVLAWQKLHELDDPVALSGWLYSIAKNLLRNHHRKYARLTLAEPDELGEWLDQQPVEDSLGDANEMRLSLLQQCLLKLNHEAQRTLRLYYRDGYSLQELQNLLGIRHSTLTMRLNRYRQKLRECLQKDIG